LGSAFINNIGSNLSVIFLLAKATIKSRYRGTAAGFIWVILNPLSQLLIQAIVFSAIFENENDTYLLYLTAGLVPWFFIQQSFDMAIPILKYQGRFLRNFSAKPIHLVAAQIIDNFFVFLIAYVVSIFSVCWYLKVYPILNLVLLVVPIINLFLLILMGSFLFSLLNVLYADIRFVVSFLMTLSFFATPIFYTVDQLPQALQFWIQFNPMAHVIGQFQSSIFAVGFADWARGQAGAWILLGILGVINSTVWQRTKNSVQKAWV
jgi:lipopolysaccharide transport system permease protein